MEAMNKDGFDTWLQDSLQDHESAIPMGGWQGLHQAKKKKRRFRFLWPFAAAALVVLGAGIGYYARNTNTAEPTLSVDNEEVKSLDRQVASENLKEETQTNRPNETTNEPTSLAHIKPALVHKKQEPSNYTRIPKTTIGPDSSQMKQAGDSIPVGVIRILKFDFKLDSLSPKIYENSPIDFASDRIFSRRRFRGIYVQIAANTGEMYFKTKDAKNLEPNYGSIINQSNLNERSLSFGLGTEFSLSPHFALFGGVQYDQSTIEGAYDYAYYSYANDPLGNANQSWVSNPRLQSTNYRYDLKITTQRLSVPLVLRYRLHYGTGPLAEIGATYSYAFKTSGDWMNPQDLQPNAVPDQFSPKHQLSTQFGLGYALRIKRSQVALIYQFSPWSASFTPPGGQMGANQHGLKLQWQMPY